MTSDTRERIVTTAEILFAKHGYSATSLRQITKAADVNLAAVNYHFGSKENLLIEILDRVMGPMNDERIKLLDEAETRGDLEVRAVLTAFLLPDLHAIETLKSRDPALPRFVSRMYSESSDLMASLMGRQFAEIQQRFLTAFSSALPDVAPSEIGWRIRCVVGIVVYLFAGVETSGMPPILGPDTSSNLERLLSVTVPIMTAQAVMADR